MAANGKQPNRLTSVWTSACGRTNSPVPLKPSSAIPAICFFPLPHRLMSVTVIPQLQTLVPSATRVYFFRHFADFVPVVSGGLVSAGGLCYNSVARCVSVFHFIHSFLKYGGQYACPRLPRGRAFSALNGGEYIELSGEYSLYYTIIISKKLNIVNPLIYITVKGGSMNI